MIAKTQKSASKIETSTKGAAGPIESCTGPPTKLKAKAEIPMKKVSVIVMAPLTSRGRFFMNSDSSEITCRIEKTIKRENSANALVSCGYSSSLNM